MSHHFVSSSIGSSHGNIVTMDPITKASEEHTKHLIILTESSFSGKEVVLYVCMFVPPS